MKTKAQKAEEIKEAAELLKKNENLVFTDFTGVSFEFLKKLKVQLKKSGATFKVVKKRLLRVAMKEQGIEYDPVQFDAQVGTIFVPKSLSESASIIYKFAKEVAKAKKEFKILGAFDMKEKKALTGEEFTVIAKLPSREVLLGMVLGAITGPLRAFMYLLQELAKRTPAGAGSPDEASSAEAVSIPEETTTDNKTVEQTQ
jgi:large subunit ribosomal protein L10